MPFDMVVGACNPLAPPIELWFEPPVALGRAVFSPTYEGAPGWVHGSALAAAFDIILTAANVLADAAGPTVELTIRYKRPTLIGVESLFESRVIETTERRTHSRGVLTQNGQVTVEAVGEFVNIDHDKIAALHRMRTRHDGVE
jgi:acyl-coenzyme A thioesterase PaaI-like protein